MRAIVARATIRRASWRRSRAVSVGLYESDFAFSFSLRQTKFSDFWYWCQINWGRRLFWPLGSLRRTEAPVNGEFLFCFFLVTGSLQRRSQHVVDLRISRGEALRHT